MDATAGRRVDRKYYFCTGGTYSAGRAAAFAKEILLHLLHDYFLIFAAGWIQAVFVQKHFAELGPAGPGFAGDLIVDFIAEFRIERRLVQSRKFFVKLGAKYLVLGHDRPLFDCKKIISQCAECGFLRLQFKWGAKKK